MNENQWTKSICKKLDKSFKEYGLKTEVFREMPYAFEVLSYDSQWHIDGDENEIRFETDMVVYEQIENKIIPRVIIESKINSISTHDAITYSYKAQKHKDITPFLRYGIMLGNRKEHPLPGRLFRHGSNFDFMFSFKGEKPNAKEWDSFVQMIKEEVDYSRQLEEMFKGTRKKERKKYYLLQKKLELKEM